MVDGVVATGRAGQLPFIPQNLLEIAGKSLSSPLARLWKVVAAIGVVQAPAPKYVCAQQQPRGYLQGGIFGNLKQIGGTRKL